MTGAWPGSARGLRRTIRGRGIFLPLVGLIGSLGCATIGEYLHLRIVSPPSPAAALETDREIGSPADDLCNGAVLPITDRVHLVRAGETLSEIALHYRVPVSALSLINPIVDPDRIEVGQHLSLPADALYPTRPLIPRKSSPIPSRAEILMAEAETHYQAARFEMALALSREARTLMEGESDRSKQLARAAFLAGSAWAGLGNERRASAEFDRVHALDAHFEPPNGWLSPRLGVLYGEPLAK